MHMVMNWYKHRKIGSNKNYEGINWRMIWKIEM